MPCQQQSNCKDAICNANDGVYASRSIRNVTIDLMPKVEHSRWTWTLLMWSFGPMVSRALEPWVVNFWSLLCSVIGRKLDWIHYSRSCINFLHHSLSYEANSVSWLLNKLSVFMESQMFITVFTIVPQLDPILNCINPSRIWSVLMMVYNTQNYWISGLYSSSGVLNNKITQLFGNFICFRPQVRWGRHLLSLSTDWG
jgi:hypothetical protein